MTTRRNWKPSLVAVAVLTLSLVGLAGPACAQDAAAQKESDLELELAIAERDAAAQDSRPRPPRHSVGLSGSIQGDPGARFGVDANAAVEYRWAITRTLTGGVALPADVTTGRRGFRLILEDPDVSLGWRLFALRLNGRPVVLGGVGAAHGVRLGAERNPVRVEGALSFPVPGWPLWAIDVSVGRQFRVGDDSSRYATLGISRAF